MDETRPAREACFGMIIDRRTRARDAESHRSAGTPYRGTIFTYSKLNYVHYSTYVCDTVREQPLKPNISMFSLIDRKRHMVTIICLCPKAKRL